LLLARVIGNIWGARQASSLEGYRLLLVQPLGASCGGEGTGASRVVVDSLGAGPGELVLVAHGSRCRDITLGVEVATKEVTVAIVDDYTIEDQEGAA
jgi:microcompartment protein CcmK/EutM